MSTIARKSSKFGALVRASLGALLTRPSSTAGDCCPTSADEIVTDRPDVTNSSLVVPYGSLQAENGVDWTVSHGSNALDGTNTRLRLGIAPCTEFLIAVPNYFFSINGPEGSGFGDLVVSFKRQVPVPFGFELSATGGLGFPSGSGRISGHGYEPYIQFPWSHEIAKGWEAVGMFTLTWFPGESRRNPTFEPTLLPREGIRSLHRHVPGIRRRLRPSTTHSGHGYRRRLAVYQDTAARLSRRFRSQQQFGRSLFRHRVFVPLRRAIRRFGWTFAVI